MNDIKEKIIVFAIGLLVGAVTATGAFCAYTIISNNHGCKNKTINMQGGNLPSMNNREQNDNQSSGQPPEKPGDTNSQNNNDSQNKPSDEQNNK